MNKQLIALAIVGAFAAPVAMADSGNVVIYGKARVSVDSVDGDSADGERRTRVSSNNSRLGFKGSEDLGNGLSAVWQIESLIKMDEQGSSLGLGTRSTFAGLAGKQWGSLTLGYQDSPLKTSTGPLGVYGDTLGDYRSVFTKLSTRAKNSVLYTTPNMSGLVGRVMYGARNEAGNGNNSDPSMYALSGVYKNGPLYATLAYENNKNVSPTNISYNNDAWRAGAGYTFGNTKLGLAYENNNAEDSDGLTTNDGSAWYASVAHKMGNVTLNGAYTDRGEYTSGANNGAKQMTVGADYALSKRTMVYALYTMINNDRNGDNGIGEKVGVAQVDTIAGGDPSGFSLGMNHNF